MLLIRDLVKTYPSGVQALKGITLEIQPGMFGLLGPNGAGVGLVYLYSIGYNHWLYNPLLYQLWKYQDLTSPSIWISLLHREEAQTKTLPKSAIHTHF